MDDSFFDLGGDSLSAMRLVAAVNTGLDAGLSVRTLFEAPTVAQLAPRIGGDEVGWSRWWPWSGPTVVPLSFSQNRLWFLDQLQGPSPMYNMPVGLRLHGQLDADALGAAVADVVGRHESLRTLFAAPRAYPSSWWCPPSEPTSVGRSSMPPTGRKPQLERPSAPWRVTRSTWRPRSPCGHGFSASADDEHVLVAVVHHIAADGWSIGPAGAATWAWPMSADARGQPPSGPPLPVQYVDYTLWQREQLGDLDDADSLVAAQLAYWQRCAGGDARAAAAADRPAVSAGG